MVTDILTSSTRRSEVTELKLQLLFFLFKKLRQAVENAPKRYFFNSYSCKIFNNLTLLAIVKRQKLAWFGYVTRHNSFSKTILQGTSEGGQRRGRQRKCWMDNIKEWTSTSTLELLTRLEKDVCGMVFHVPQTSQLVKALN